MSNTHIALLYYDYYLTFPAEVKYIWGAKFKTSTVLYVCCRYALLANVLYLLAIAHVLKELRSCNVWYTVNGYLSIVGRAAVLAIFAARTWAVCSRSKAVLFALGSLATACIGLDFWHVTGVKCSGPSSPSSHISNTSLSILVCIFECTATVITIVRCMQALQMLKKNGRRPQESNIMYFMLKEGLLYFCGVFIFTFTAVVLNFEEPTGFFGSLLNALTLPISGLLSARLLLHLRAWSQRHLVSLSRDEHGLGDADGGNPHEPRTRRKGARGGYAHGHDKGQLPSFHAATVRTESDVEMDVGMDGFGGDPVGNVMRDPELSMGWGVAGPSGPGSKPEASRWREGGGEVRQVRRGEKEDGGSGGAEGVESISLRSIDADLEGVGVCDSYDSTAKREGKRRDMGEGPVHVVIPSDV
ncbi:hypothetical protein SERLADRAFT_409612 [Serpula lacrymans var. lacrymans S7.9]|uniref:DUF6533 domain-containing protein n=1 Tax=Serpula lacrymans var. lacrymans (strain S7.9) TaxID=578457 RepID=F8P235_SERL9|nr:uncharacterized protein SERLADRAFT_409612 [Serpula lacrymans var. lacrymans S7.9]EGO23213.1 hypothetical protein SERLADRAFT_409612 [Serpula lacrymans var. lacrymans S7.9]